MKKWFKPISDNLLAYSYKVLEEKEDEVTLQAGNGCNVIFKKVGDKPTKAVMLSNGSEWAIRQVADIFSNNPCFKLEKNSEGGYNSDVVSPWLIVFKEIALESREIVRGILLKD